MTYALGIGVNEYRDLNSFRHGGADIAHRAFAIYFPEINSGVIAMSNNANFDPGKVGYKLAFEKDPAGKVTGFAASNGRTKGISFERY